MVKNSRWIVIMVMTLVAHWGFAQTNRYVVYFTDKSDTEFSISSPSTFLSAKAIERRENQGIEVTTVDLPVNAAYLNSIEDLEIKTYYTSRWLNAVLVEATAVEIETIAALSFVEKTDYAAPGQKMAATPDPENTTRENNPPANAANLNSNKQLSMLVAQTMHQEEITGKGVWIAVLDDGFLDANRSAAFNHTFENDRLKDVMDFTTGGKDVFQYDDHGTSSWSCLGAKYESQVVGTGFDADISLYVTEDVSSEYRIEEYNWLFAAERADSAGVDIITSSLGYSTFDDGSMNYSIEDLDGETSIISQAAKLATERGMLVVTSAGNSGNIASWPYISMPADAEHVVSVGALDTGFDLVSFSSIGPTADDRIKPEVVALGQGVTLISEGNVVAQKNGTSFSAPLIAGFAAGLWQKFPTLTNIELRDLLLSSSDNFSTPNNRIGYGIPDYNIAVGNEPLAVADLMSDGISIFPNPVTGDHINLLIERDAIPMPIKFSLFSPDGRLIHQKSIKRARKGLVTDLHFKESNHGLYILSIECEAYSKNVKILRY